MFEIHSKEFSLAISSVLKAGKIVREIYNSAFEVSWKAKDDPLTEADLQANQIILDIIQSEFPQDGVLSEEIKDNSNRLTKDRVWILDPIDGTREFVQKIPEFSISLGFSYKGKATIGVVLNPITKELFTGIVGMGASYNIVDDNLYLAIDKIKLGKQIYNARKQIPEVFVSRSEFYKHELFDKNPYWKESFTLKPVGSIAYKLALLSANKADFCISLKPKNEWDICAGVALVEATGGLVTDLQYLDKIEFNAENPRKNGIIAGNPNIVGNLIRNKREFFKSSLVDWN